MSSPGFFDAFRVNGAPTYYPPNKTPWMADILESGLIFAFVILAFSFFIVLPGIRGIERLFVFIRITVTLFIGAVIVIANFSYEWEVSSLTNVRTKYKAGESRDIHADIGVHIGLRGVNITLEGDDASERLLNETIFYNENFDWRWEQGRFGFGIFAGRFNQEYRAAQFRGLPFPILWIAEYFTFDGEGIRWGRHYRQAGWYAHIMMWLALPMWFLTVILFFVLLKYGALFLMMTGGIMVIANILWATIRNFNELKIPINAEAMLEFRFGGAYWINLVTGIACILLGAVIYFMDLRFPRQTTAFFGVDPLQDDDSNAPDEKSSANANGTRMNGIEMEPVDGQANTASNGRARGADNDDDDDDDDEIYEPPQFHQPPKQEPKRKSRTKTIRDRLQAPRRRAPPPVPDDEEQELYENSNRANPDQVHLNMGYRR